MAQIFFDEARNDGAGGMNGDSFGVHQLNPKEREDMEAIQRALCVPLGTRDLPPTKETVRMLHATGFEWTDSALRKALDILVRDTFDP